MTDAIYDVEKAASVLSRRLKPQWIEKRQQGGTNVTYIGGHIVIHLLNEAFNYQWNFEVVTEQEVKHKKPRKNQQGAFDEVTIAKVLGRLTVPGLCVKEQYGTCTYNNGNVEQAFKIAATDALKKCASLLGIGLELSKNANVQDFYHMPNTTPQVQQLPVDEWGKVAPEVSKLNALKQKLKITNDDQLEKFIQQFFQNGNAKKKDLTPRVIAQFNTFLEKQAG